MDIGQLINMIVSLSVIGIIMLIFLKFIIFGDIVERNLDKIVEWVIKQWGKKVKK